MKQLMILAAAVILAVSAMADTFGTGANQFTIEFVPISGVTNPEGGFGIVNYDYRIGKYEITNEQWKKFESQSGLSLGSSYFAGENLPVNKRSWFEVAKFVNWLNEVNGYQEAYKFVNNWFSPWDTSEAWAGSNLYRHKDAFYFLPTEDEWFKAAYWNGTAVQSFATKEGEILHQGDGVGGTGWNYYGAIGMPWNVGSGSEELNGTFDMMGNVWEWTESPYIPGDYLSGSERAGRGGTYYTYRWISCGHTSWSSRLGVDPNYDKPGTYHDYFGFRVASIPEPTTLLLLGLGGVMVRQRGKGKGQK